MAIQDYSYPLRLKFRDLLSYAGLDTEIKARIEWQDDLHPILVIHIPVTKEVLFAELVRISGYLGSPNLIGEERSKLEKQYHRIQDLWKIYT